MDRQTIFIDFTGTSASSIVQLRSPSAYFASSGPAYQQLGQGEAFKQTDGRYTSEAQLDLTTIVDDILRAYSPVIERLSDR